MNLENFKAALNSLGKNDRERAQALGCSVRSIIRLRSDGLPGPCKRFYAHPDLLRGLLQDAEHQQDRQAKSPQPA